MSKVLKVCCPLLAAFVTMLSYTARITAMNGGDSM